MIRPPGPSASADAPAAAHTPGNTPADEGAERLRAHVAQLAGEIGERNVYRPRSLEATQAYLRSCWQEQGYAVDEQAYTTRGVRCANLEVTASAGQLGGRILLLGAHYDTVPGSPGANDNATGVATLLELSRRFAKASLPCEMRFVAFANEESPFFLTRDQGSVRYAKRARARRENIRLMISLETMGCYRDRPGSQDYPPLLRRFYPDRGNFIAFVSNLRSRPALKRLARAFRAASDFPAEHIATLAIIPGVAWSDHLSFWRQGYRAVMITDTAFYRYPYYHTAEDTPDKIDYHRLAAVTQGLTCALWTLAHQRGL
ncbi:MAG: M20/M25/M40 family metallo-hydrolase [Nitrococcus sp.]|nr:M20/M25/M40 family metallo-hydrolase [Nitrococcus sp.]